MTRIDVRNLRKSHGSFEALNGCSFSLSEGSLLALLGPSGCGKSTMLQLLAGFDTPTSGEIWVGSEMLSSPQRVIPPEHRGISLVFQNYAVWPHKTVAENVAFGLKLRKLGRSELDTRLTRALDTVRLNHLRDRYPFELSGGQQQRVALARALAVEPKILLLDEPLSNLDAQLREEMRFEIRRVHDELGLTTVYVTHDQGEALVTADQVAVMKAGAVQQLGSPEEIFEQPANTFVASFIGTNNEVQGTIEAPGVIRVGQARLFGRVQGDAQAGAKGTLCIRPSKVRLGERRDGQNYLQGTVSRSAYLGEYRDILISLPEGASLRAFVPPHIKLSAGETVDIHLPVENCQIYPSA